MRALYQGVSRTCVLHDAGSGANACIVSVYGMRCCIAELLSIVSRLHPLLPTPCAHFLLQACPGARYRRCSRTWASGWAWPACCARARGGGRWPPSIPTSPRCGGCRVGQRVGTCCARQAAMPSTSSRQDHVGLIPPYCTCRSPATCKPRGCLSGIHTPYLYPVDGGSRGSSGFAPPAEGPRDGCC